MLVLAALLTFADLNPSMQRMVAGWGHGDAGRLAQWIDEIEGETSRRLQEGERDHLVFYMLQSTAFTTEPRIEPALSARDFHSAGHVPAPVQRRIAALTKTEPVRVRGVDLEAEYRRAMAFLYDKEFGSKSRQGEARRAYVASLYQGRGHSADTSPDNLKAMLEGIRVIRQQDPSFNPRRVLVIGPGLDWAPRTGHRDAEPRTYQPQALREVFGPDAVIVCADINPRVVQAVNAASLPGVRAEQWNILTRKPEGPPFDLVVATNVLLYFDNHQLALAVHNIHGAMASGAWFLHNDLRGEMDAYGATFGLALEDARMIRLSEARELFDSFALHRRR